MKPATPSVKRDLTRIVYWANNGRAKEMPDMLRAAGYEVGHRWQEAERPKGRWYHEWWVSLRGDTVGMIHEFSDESFLFLWTPEARTSRWSYWLWRVRHPRTREELAA